MTAFLTAHLLLVMVAGVALMLGWLRVDLRGQVLIIRLGMVLVPIAVLLAPLLQLNVGFESPVVALTTVAGGAVGTSAPTTGGTAVIESLPTQVPWLLLLLAPTVLALIERGLAALRLRALLAATEPSHVEEGVEVRLGASSFAAWLPGRRVVVIASDLEPEDRAVVLRHELIHVRQADPQFAWVASLFRAFFILNPAAWWLESRLRALDELRCDAAVPGPDLTADTYAETLIRVARRGLSQPVPPGAVRMANPASLPRRLDMLLTDRPRRVLRVLPATLLLGALLTGGAVVAIASGPAQPITLAERDHPVLQNRLDHVLDSEERVASMRRAIETRSELKTQLERRFAALDAPAELVAVALVESRFQNLDRDINPVGAAGVWQFMPKTARTYGLTVEDVTDQRLDVAQSTDAAARLLVDLHASFGDWGLAIAAYNAGPDAVRAAIEQHGTRDVLELIEAGALPTYAADVMVGMRLIAEPGLLR